jgi:hypothetical protein
LQWRVVGAVGLVPAASAWALGPTGAETVVAPVTTSPVTAPGLSLFVVSDSVVATATLRNTEKR